MDGNIPVCLFVDVDSLSQRGDSFWTNDECLLILLANTHYLVITTGYL
jgi:hypothetical protein